jgi:uncharacterized protein (DUF1800 family)
MEHPLRRLITTGLLAIPIAAFFFTLSGHAAELTEQQKALHVLNRLGYGPRPGDVDRIVSMGVDKYIDAQLHPESIPLPPALEQQLRGLTYADASAGDMLEEFYAMRKEAKQDGDEGKQERRETARRMTDQIGEARLIRAIDSPRQLEEVMVDFWFNHFNVYAGKGLDRALVSSYERDAIRPYVLGRFRDLLGATAKHPAMLFYLDNWLSAAPGYQPPRNRGGPAANATGLNENYARELMELHTLGVDGGYTQRDVTELARMLTGWTFNPKDLVRRGNAFRFDERRHDMGDKEWLGRHVGGRGQGEGEWALDILAAHPATAKHIAFELAQYFVADQPPPALVDRVAKRFLDTQGDIRATLKTLFSSPEFWEASQFDAKFKTPYQYVISAVRAADLHPVNPRPLMGALSGLGMPLYGCQTPDGYKNTEEAWLSPDALTRRINFATALSTGHLPLMTPPEEMENKQASATEKGMSSDEHRMPPLDPARLTRTLDAALSEHTRETVASSPPQLQAALLLGSPEFMKH